MHFRIRIKLSATNEKVNDWPKLSPEWVVGVWSRQCIQLQQHKTHRHVSGFCCYGELTHHDKLNTLSLSLCFNGHFPGGSGLAGTRMSPFCILLQLRMMEVVVTTAAIGRAKLQSNHHHQQTNIQLFTGRITFLSNNRSWQSTEGKKYNVPRNCSPKLTWRWGFPTFSLITKGSCLP